MVFLFQLAVKDTAAAKDAVVKAPEIAPPTPKTEQPVVISDLANGLGKALLKWIPGFSQREMFKQADELGAEGYYWRERILKGFAIVTIPLDVIALTPGTSKFFKYAKEGTFAERFKINMNPFRLFTKEVAADIKENGLAVLNEVKKPMSKAVLKSYEAANREVKLERVNYVASKTDKTLVKVRYTDSKGAEIYGQDLTKANAADRGFSFADGRKFEIIGSGDHEFIKTEFDEIYFNGRRLQAFKNNKEELVYFKDGKQCYSAKGNPITEAPKYDPAQVTVNYRVSCEEKQCTFKTEDASLNLGEQRIKIKRKTYYLGDDLVFWNNEGTYFARGGKTELPLLENKYLPIGNKMYTKDGLQLKTYVDSQDKIVYFEAKTPNGQTRYHAPNGKMLEEEPLAPTMKTVDEAPTNEFLNKITKSNKVKRALKTKDKITESLKNAWGADSEPLFVKTARGMNATWHSPTSIATKVPKEVILGGVVLPFTVLGWGAKKLVGGVAGGLAYWVSVKSGPLVYGTALKLGGKTAVNAGAEGLDFLGDVAGQTINGIGDAFKPDRGTKLFTSDDAKAFEKDLKDKGISQTLDKKVMGSINAMEAGDRIVLKLGGHAYVLEKMDDGKLTLYGAAVDAVLSGIEVKVGQPFSITITGLERGTSTIKIGDKDPTKAVEVSLEYDGKAKAHRTQPICYNAADVYALQLLDSKGVPLRDKYGKDIVLTVNVVDEKAPANQEDKPVEQKAPKSKYSLTILSGEKVLEGTDIKVEKGAVITLVLKDEKGNIVSDGKAFSMMVGNEEKAHPAIQGGKSQLPPLSLGTFTLTAPPDSSYEWSPVKITAEKPGAKKKDKDAEKNSGIVP